MKSSSGSRLNGVSLTIGLLLAICTSVAFLLDCLNRAEALTQIV
jgi:hypothetical protein